MGPDKVEKLCQRAQLAIAERDWDKAKQAYLMALGLRSDLPDVHYGLATVYFQQRELTSAAHHFREVTRLDPHKAGAFINLGAVLNLMEQFDDAINALRKGIQLDGARVEGYYNLGVVYKRKGQADLAITAYKEALRINPRMADAHLNLANLLLERNKPRDALHHYEQAQQLRPGWEKSLDGIAEAKGVIAAEKAGKEAAPGTPVGPARAATPGGDLDRMIDPVVHGAFLSNLHQAAIVSEETGRLLQKVVGEEVEPVVKELSTVLLHKHGSRGELDACLSKFEAALNRMRTAHQALKTAVGKVEEIGTRFPTR
ncbi:MAG: tetratricopeptide repeat protein [Gemmataceae bacterium]